MDPISLLRKIVSIPSYSQEEDKVADFICSVLKDDNLDFERIHNNIIISSKRNKGNRPHLLFCTHIDTVSANSNYSFDPFNSPILKDRVLGLGSNDAGGCIVSQYQTFKLFQEKEIPLDISLIFSAEEECSGSKGIDFLSERISQSFDFAIVGEPTANKVAIAEKGLLVIDAESVGKAGHAARNEGINAIEIAIEDIKILKSLDIKANVTQINAGTQHNVIPDSCRWVIDIRTDGKYSNEEIMNSLNTQMKSRLIPRSMSNRSSFTPEGHILLKAISKCQIEQYISPTTSDWMKLSIPAIKLGPGDSSRSHKSNEYIKINEITEGIAIYSQIINTLSEIIENGK